MMRGCGFDGGFVEYFVVFCIEFIFIGQSDFVMFVLFIDVGVMVYVVCKIFFQRICLGLNVFVIGVGGFGVYVVQFFCFLIFGYIIVMDMFLE